MGVSTLVAFDFHVKPEELLKRLNQEMLLKPSTKFSVDKYEAKNFSDQGNLARLSVYHNGGRVIEWDKYEYGGDIPDAKTRASLQAELKAMRYAYPGGMKTLINMDTDYSFGSRDSLNAGDIHVGFIFQIHEKIVKPAGGKMMWRDEYSGEWFKGLTGLDRLSRNTINTQQAFNDLLKRMNR